MWCFRRNRSKKELYKAMVNNLVLAEESNQALLAQVQRLTEEKSDLVNAQAEETRNLKEQVTQLQTDKSALEKDYLDSTVLIQHQLDTTLQEKTSLQLSLQEATAELQTAMDMNKEVTNFSTILKEENQAMSTELQSLKLTLNKEKQDLSTELQSVQQTLRTLEKLSEEDRRRKDSIMNDAEHYIEELETKMQNQEMHLRKEMEEEVIKCKAQEAKTHKLKEQVTQLQTDKSALEKDFLDSTALIQHQLDTTLQEKTSLQLSLQEATAELQTAMDMNNEVTNFSTILKEENQPMSTELQSVQQTLKEENQALSTELQSLKVTLNKEKQDLFTELQSVQQTLRTLEKRVEGDTRRKDSIMNEAGLYIDELKTEMQDQEMHLRKEMEEAMMKCKEEKALAQRSLRKALDENLRLKYELKSPSKQQIQDPQEDHAPHYPPKKWRHSRQKTVVYTPNQALLVTVPKN